MKETEHELREEDKGKQMNYIHKKIILTVGIVLAIFSSSNSFLIKPACADANLPMSYQPLGNVVKNMPGSDWIAVQQTAQNETNSQPVYKSNAVENITFAGYLQATDSTTRLAILSDDGADVYIDGQKILSGYQQPQALPELSSSLHQLNFVPNPAHVYYIKIVYSNIILSGLTDIDGITLFCYGGGVSLLNLTPSLSVRRTLDPNAPSNTPQNSWGTSVVIAAGASSNKQNQSDVLVTLLKQDNTPAVGVFVDNPSVTNGDGATQNAQIVPVSQTTDSNGNATFSYTGSDQVSTSPYATTTASSPPMVNLSYGTSSVTVDQHWNDTVNGSQWKTDTFFQTNVPANVSFMPTITDTKSVPITGHTITFVVTSVDVSTYDSSSGTYKDTEYSTVAPTDPSASPPVVNVSSLDQYAKFTKASVTDSGGGVYNAQLLVTDNNVDSVEFDAEDYSVFGN